MGYGSVMTADIAAHEIMTKLQTAWSMGDGDAFASQFTHDADFVNIVGDVVRGRAHIATHHDEIFGSVYQGSTMRVDSLRTTEIAPGVATIEAAATVISSFGELGTHAFAVILERDETWAIRSFHNMVPFSLG